MKSSLFKHKIICLFIILLGVAVDYLTKQLVIDNMKLYESIPLWEGVLHLTHVQNKGAAFSMLSGHRWVFLSVSTVAIIFMLGFLLFVRDTRKMSLYSIALIVSGGIGNMIDRVYLGYVTDFIDFRLINFAVFNAADCFVCIGAGLLILDLVIDLIQDPKGEKSKTSADIPQKEAEVKQK